MTMSTTENGLRYRVIWGWGAFEDFDDLDDARFRRDDLNRARNGAVLPWERDPALRTPAVFERDADGRYLTEIQ